MDTGLTSARGSGNKKPATKDGFSGSKAPIRIELMHKGFAGRLFNDFLSFSMYHFITR